jgi:hypothetical protein
MVNMVVRFAKIIAERPIYHESIIGRPGDDGRYVRAALDPRALLQRRDDDALDAITRSLGDRRTVARGANSQASNDSAPPRPAR